MGVGGYSLTPKSTLDPQEKATKQIDITLNKNKEQQEQTTPLAFTYQNQTYWNNTTEYANTHTYYWNQNSESASTSSAYNIRANKYESKKICLVDGVSTSAYMPLYNTFQSYNGTLYGIQITPNNAVMENSINLSLGASYDATNFSVLYNGDYTPKKAKLVLRIRILQTTSKKALTYIGANPNLSPTMLTDWYEDLKSSITLNYDNYIERTFYRDADIATLVHQGNYWVDDGTGRAITYSFSEDLDITNQQTNYAFVYIQARYRIVDGNNVEITSAQEVYANVYPENTRSYSTFQNWQLLPSKTLTFTTIYVPSFTTEVVDIPGLMWEILTMPFAFLSTAFNLTLFPGTPYQLNVANLILMLLGILTFIFIFKLFLKKI